MHDLTGMPPAPHMDACGAREQRWVFAPSGLNARGVCELPAALRDVGGGGVRAVEN